MATWESFTVENAINHITDHRMVLPVIQRRLVWSEEQMEKLFDTLLRQDSFGGIMVIEEEKGQKPMFECRYFSIDGKNVSSISTVTPWPAATQVVIDGQQRLQTFYIGLRGQLNGRQLYINLGTDAEKLEFELQFATERRQLPEKSPDDNGVPTRNIWFTVPALYERLTSTNNDRPVARMIIAEEAVVDEALKDRIEENVRSFFMAIFNNRTVGISKVTVIPDELGPARNKQRIVELFQRLNDGGTKLSSFDLMASVLKSYDWRMEGFLDEVLASYGELSLGQDELIKLIFILQDKSAKEVSDIEDADAQFAIGNRERIRAALDAMAAFLRNAGLFEWFRLPGRSVIPLYCIAYHFFHKSSNPEAIRSALNQFDVKSGDFRAMKRWLVFSILCGVFRSRGAGWVAYKTGLYALSAQLCKHKGQEFPCTELFQIYRGRLRFFEDEITDQMLGKFDQQFLFYLLYDGTRVVRQQDVDHIHPKSLLSQRGVSEERINSLPNFQLIDTKTNRGVKNGSELRDWIEGHVTERKVYLARHLIPLDEALWHSAQFDRFYEARQKLVIDKLHAIVAA
jgi:hypothetical protein